MMAGSPTESNDKDRPPPSARHLARLAAIQAVYQSEMAGEPPEPVIVEFMQHRLDDLGLSPRAAGARAFFGQLVRGAAAEAGALDARIAAALGSGWTIDRLGAVALALLRVATFEIQSEIGIPVRASIAEYVTLAHGFLDADQARFVNAVLDHIARELRGAEMRDAQPHAEPTDTPASS